MIVPMRKYSFLVFHKEVDTFLQGLMDLGVLHVLNKGSVNDEYAEDLVAEIKLGEQVKKSFLKRNESNEVAINLREPMPDLLEITHLEKELEQKIHLHETLQGELKLIQPWGEFRWKAIEELEAKTGLNVRFFAYPKLNFDQEWLQKYAAEIIDIKGDIVYFIIFKQYDDEEMPLIPVALPKKSISQIESEMLDLEGRIKEINNLLDAYASNYFEDLTEGLKHAKDQLEFYLTQKCVTHEMENKLVVLEGWCPETKQAELAQYAAVHKLVYVEQEPEIEEAPPVLLLNNRFSRLFEPIGEMFSLPAYSELDLTVFFAPFFLLFFGFCLGDAGYGLVILIVATIVKLRLKGDNKRYASLLQLFGLSTTVIGFLSGTLFGIEMLKNPVFSDLKHLMFNQDQMFEIALIIGFVQIIFGMIVQVYKKVIFTGWLSAISRIGWIVLLISLIDLYVLEKSTAMSGLTVWAGVALIIFFGAPEKGWLKSIGLGLADLYNITGVAGDLLSYIRLFALGVSSAILGLVVNEIAFSAGAVPYVGILLTGLILIVGHSANLMLASLSAFVHPMRLTFVEFYKNVGFIGGGKPYQPFKRFSKVSTIKSNSSTQLKT